MSLSVTIFVLLIFLLEMGLLYLQYLNITPNETFRIAKKVPGNTILSLLPQISPRNLTLNVN